MNKNVLRDHYDRKYSFEREGATVDVIKSTETPISRFEAVVKYFPQYFKGGDILEMGAGNGNVAKTLLLSSLNIKSYTVGDISLSRVEGIKRNINDSRVKILEMDAENIPESEHGKYDAVIMVALIEHLVDPLSAMANIRKLLKVGGFVYIDTPNIAKYTQRIKLLFGRFPSTGSMNEGLTTHLGQPVDLHDEGHLHYFTYRSLSKMLVERCNYTKIEKLSYPGGRTVLGKRIHDCLARIWPQMFSELVLIAFR